MKRVRMWAYAAVLVALGIGAPSWWWLGREPTPPNVLLIIADDLGIEHVAAYGLQGPGGDYASLPRLDSLAASGQLYRKAYAEPVCSPARAELLTGRYPTRTLVGTAVQSESDYPLQRGEVTLAEALAPAGYRSAIFGKWHLGGAPNEALAQGFSHAMVTWGNILPFGWDFYSWSWYVDGVETPATGYLTTATVDAALEWIGAQSGPWLAVVAYQAPHAPVHCPPIELSPHGCGDGGTLALYQAMAESVDTETGRLIDGAPGALVFFASDNGSADAVALAPFAPGKVKHTVFEGGVRVPFLVSGPGVAPGQVTGLATLADVYPTVLELAGVEPPPGVVLDGVSLVPYFTDSGQPSIRTFAMAEIFEPGGAGPYATYQRAVRESSDGYKYMIWTGGKESLVDLVADPWETVNLLKGKLTPEQQDALLRLRGEAQSYRNGKVE